MEESSAINNENLEKMLVESSQLIYSILKVFEEKIKEHKNESLYAKTVIASMPMITASLIFTLRSDKESRMRELTQCIDTLENLAVAYDEETSEENNKDK